MLIFTYHYIEIFFNKKSPVLTELGKPYHVIQKVFED